MNDQLNGLIRNFLVGEITVDGPQILNRFDGVVHGSSLDRHLEQEGLLGYFNQRIYSCDFDCRKPDRRIFISAAERIDVKPENIMFVGDRIDADIKGSMAVGMRPVMKTAYTNKRKKAVDGVPIISLVSELPALVEKANRKNPVFL